MRRYFLTLVIVLAIGLMTTLAQVHAKTQFEISPSSGPGGITIAIEGSGFCDGDISVVLSLTNPIEPGASAGALLGPDETPPRGMKLVAPRAQEAGFKTTAAMPSREEVLAFFGEAPETVYVLALQPLREGCSQTEVAGTFSIGAPFTYSVGLAEAGAGNAELEARWPRTVIAALVATAVLFSTAALGLRARHALS